MTAEQTVETVTGSIPSGQLGRTLVHEHILVDFIGANAISRSRYDADEAFRAMLPYLEALVRKGFDSFIECTPMYLGRDPLLLRKLSSASGLNILTNTGLYAAGQREGSPEPFLPAYAYTLEAEELAGGWLKEWYEGIEGTGVRPGFIKIGVNPGGELRTISEKIVRSAAITSRYTGLAIACHTVSGRSALRILEILDREQVAPDRYIYVHAQGEENQQLHRECARRGAWIEYDGVRPKSADRHLSLIVDLLDAGHEDQLLISQDAGWYRPGEPGGGDIRGFDFLAGEFRERLIREGVSSATLDHLLIHNPKRAFQLAG